MIALFLLPIYALVNYYLFVRILRWFQICHKFFKNRIVMYSLLSIYIFFASSALISFLLPKGKLCRFMAGLSNYWLGILMYLFLVILIADIIRIIAKRNGKLYKSKLYTPKGFMINGIICSIVIIAICTYGFINARIIHTTNYDVKIDKQVKNMDNLKVVMIADLHIGYSIDNSQIARMVNKINQENADLVVICGDIFDNSYDAIDDVFKLVSLLKSIKSKYGTYAVYGNHDISEKILVGFTFNYRDKKQSDLRMDKILSDSNITLLRDQTILIDDSFYLVGRADATRPGRNIDERKTASDLLKNLDKSKPIIVLDHQPRELDLLKENGADLDLSGHTHDGQIFPMNIIVHMVWDNAYGIKEYGDFKSIVTSGVGVYGPNMRIATIAEVNVINIEFKK